MPSGFTTRTTTYISISPPKITMSEALSNNHLWIMNVVPAQYGDDKKYSIKITFGFEGCVPYLINPTKLAKKFWTGAGNEKRARYITYKWPSKCRLCESESHLTESCLWPNFEAGGRKPHLVNCRFHGPGWVENIWRDKNEASEARLKFANIGPKMKTSVNKSKAKAESSKEKGKAQDAVMEAH
jgi:hypothetical protein